MQVTTITIPVTLETWKESIEAYSRYSEQICRECVVAHAIQNATNRQVEINCSASLGYRGTFLDNSARILLPEFAQICAFLFDKYINYNGTFDIELPIGSFELTIVIPD